MPARLPPVLRCFAPKLARDQVLDLALAHILDLDAMVTGKATDDTLWNWVGSILTWSRVCELLRRHEAEMLVQAQLAKAVLDRYRRTGRIGFSGPEYQTAKTGIELMDHLAQTVDRPTAVAAADWSEATLHAMQLEASSAQVAA
jgi:hypothetical protein